MRFGLKRINLTTAINNYDYIIENTHFHVKDEESLDHELLKKININDTGMLMALGTEGLHFLSTVIRSKLEGYELSPEQEWEIYCQCDGFGKLTSEELKEINDGWDWSHIRDSSAESLLSAELKAKQFLLDIYNNK